ncbi:zinc-dependent metalloprotease [Mucilaginibacter aquaedulcis]|uniref:zinc-dependent metalloprotease n=1 Tax=Mucilaginibacter aquaedulcis TaxID=1187081 RepID=UPI0025B4C47B|nr:zinc-dependent metalloprotease [Mucilaginibacter aquaedulcis]MDN3548834.1 zinc-dependent metalloprotease [Mucilaginibacter aquaedulcis]
MKITKHLIGLALLIIFSCQAQKIFAQMKIPQIVLKPAEAAKRDSLVNAMLRTKIKPYDKVVTKDFTTQKGLFNIHRNKEKDLIYFEVPDSLFKRDIMVVNRLTKAAGNTNMYPGEELDEKTIQFELGPDSALKVRYDLIISQADSTDQIYKAVVKSSLNPIAASFPILAYGKNHKSFVIDVSKFLRDKSFVNSISAESKIANFINLPSMKDYYIEYIHNYPLNLEISITKNFDSKHNTVPAEPITLQTTCSFVLLPKVPLQRRFFDPRVGYFADYYDAFSDRQQRVESQKFILHWRLEPKDADLAKYRAGELVEPKKPIVIYIDPATPKQWRPYLIQGINDWQKAFEQAGFKNAIQGKEWPENDTTMHLDDSRYSMINYFPSNVANAYGPNIHDPRSGEIIQTHIGWYNNVMSLIHDWYMIQAGATDPKAHKAIFDDELMGQLIRMVSSHEVGHTLGLRHNFGSSSQTPVDSMRSAGYLTKYGHTASIMDYARFNYVAQPEDHISPAGLMPHIGAYDKWAIEWGYKLTFAENAEADKKIVGKWVDVRVSKDHKLWWGDGETKGSDPRSQREDLGDDAAKASIYGIKNLQRILPNLPAWNYTEGGTYENLKAAYDELLSQYYRYMGHVLKYIGNVEYTIKSEDQAGPSITPVPKAKQQAALAFFDKELFTTPYWLINKGVLEKVNSQRSPDIIEDTQVKVLNSLMDIQLINEILGESKLYGKQVFSGPEYLQFIYRSIWRELDGKGPVLISSYRRNLQKSYFQNLLVILSAKDEPSTETDASSLIRANFDGLKAKINSAIPRTHDQLTLYHLKDLQNRIKDVTVNRK